MTNKLPIDELNVLTAALAEQQANGKLTPRFAVDEVLELLVMAYALGVDAINADLGLSISPDISEMENTIFKPIAGKTFADRVSEYAEAGQIYDIARVADTEMHRVYNEAQYEAAKQSGYDLIKIWRTMGDDNVRDTHEYLEGVIVPLNGLFYTYDGDSALYPGDFMFADNNVNCRCEIEYRRA